MDDPFQQSFNSFKKFVPELSVVEESENSIEEILNKRFERGKPLYLVKWQNLSDDYNSWVMTDDIADKKLLDEFELDRCDLNKTQFHICFEDSDNIECNSKNVEECEISVENDAENDFSEEFANILHIDNSTKEDTEDIGSIFNNSKGIKRKLSDLEPIEEYPRMPEIHCLDTFNLAIFTESDDDESRFDDCANKMKLSNSDQHQHQTEK